MADDSSELPSGRSPRQRLVPIAVLGVVAVALAVLAVRVLSTEPDPPSTVSESAAATTTPPVRGVVCISVGEENDKDHCRREVADRARRQAPPDEEKGRAEAVDHEVERVIRVLDRRSEPPRVACDPAGVCTVSERKLGAADAEQVRVELAKAGHTDAAVRIAGSTDPAPVGALLYAVPVGRGCLLGYTRSTRGGGIHVLVGRLPEGPCL